MTKSQNTKNEQRCIKQNEKSFTQKDLSLTELWQKGELLDGLYYVENNSGNVGILGWSEFAGWYNIKQVLAPMPSYQEYLALVSDSLAKKEGEEIIAELEAENAQLKKFCEEFNALEVAKENEKLKEELQEERENNEFLLKSRESEILKLKDLLKECRKYIQPFIKDFTVTMPNEKIFLQELLTKIDEVLK